MEEVEAYEGTIQESLKERQKVFEHTYTQEIQSYKENQTTACECYLYELNILFFFSFFSFLITVVRWSMFSLEYSSSTGALVLQISMSYFNVSDLLSKHHKPLQDFVIIGC